jgi:hypothetical protein
MQKKLTTSSVVIGLLWDKMRRAEIPITTQNEIPLKEVMTVPL